MPDLRHLKEKEAKQLVRQFIELYPSSEPTLEAGRQFEELAVSDHFVLFVDGRPVIIRSAQRVIPTLKFDEVVNALPKIVVDMGAVAHIANGAHIMRPGIKSIDGQFSKGQLLSVTDEKHGKAVALGLADVDSVTMQSMSKGRVVTNAHYVGDEFWTAFTSIKSR